MNLKKINFIRANNLYYATIIEYKSRSNFYINMIEQKKQKQRIFEIRPVDNLILSSYHLNKNKGHYNIKKKNILNLHLKIYLNLQY